MSRKRRKSDEVVIPSTPASAQQTEADPDREAASLGDRRIAQTPATPPRLGRAKWWETLLATAAIAIVWTDLALWIVMGEPVSLIWSLYGVAVMSLGVSLAGVVALRLRSLKAETGRSSLSKLHLWVSEGRRRGEGREFLAAETFHEALSREIRRSKTYGYTVGLIVARISPEAALDAELRGVAKDRIASLARRRLRSSDVGGQLGEHEFALYLPETDRRGALIAGARLIELLDEVASVTVGIAIFPENGSSPEELIDSARSQPLPHHTEEAA